MKPEEMFLDYRMLNPKVTDYTHCLVSDDECIKLLDGRLKTFAVGQSVYDETGEEFPQIGDIQVVTDSDGEALCLIKVDSVSVLQGAHISKDIPCFPECREKELYTVLNVDVVMR